MDLFRTSQEVVDLVLLHEAHRRYTNGRSEEDLRELIIQLSRFINWVINTKFSWIADWDREDVIIEILWRVIDKVDSFKDRHKSVFTSMLWKTVYHMIIDCLRMDPLITGEKEKVDEVMWWSLRGMQNSVVNQVHVSMFLQELPDRLTQFVLSKDRFGFGKLAIGTVIRMLLQDMPVPSTMLKNWFHIRLPRLCIRFVALVVRWYFEEHKDILGDISQSHRVMVKDESGRLILVE